MNQLTKLTLSWLLLCLTLLSGCALSPQTDLEAINVSSASQAKAWELTGKLAVKTSADKFSTNLYWLHTSKKDELKLTSMLGTTLLSLTSGPQGADLVLDGQHYHGKDPQTLLKSITGWTFPISTLPLWVTGQMAPTDTIIDTDHKDRPKHVATANSPYWQLNYASWQTLSGAEIPRLMTLKQQDVRLKIQVNDWQALSD